MDNSAKLDSWNAVKKGIDEQENRKKVEAQRIYWVSIGQNVGGEVYGKSGIFTRPVLVLNVFFNGLFVGVPLSSKVRNKRGKLCHKFTDSSGKEQLALLGQIACMIAGERRAVGTLARLTMKLLRQSKRKLRGL